MAYEHKGSSETNKTEHEEECIGDDCHVAKIKAPLDHTIHRRAVEEIKERVSINESTSGPTTEERPPPPAVILACKLEVYQ